MNSSLETKGFFQTPGLDHQRGNVGLDYWVYVVGKPSLLLKLDEFRGRSIADWPDLLMNASMSMANRHLQFVLGAASRQTIGSLAAADMSSMLQCSIFAVATSIVSTLNASMHLHQCICLNGPTLWRHRHMPLPSTAFVTSCLGN